MKYQTLRSIVLAAFAAVSLTLPAGAAEPQTSPRMEKAKDYIAEEQWTRAIDVLKAAAVDPKEKYQDEALFWLAHSQHQAGDLRDAVATIRDLEQRFSTSRWVKPARSLRVELAQKLRREDVLWEIVTAPAPAPPPPDPGSTPALPPAMVTTPRPMAPPRAGRPTAPLPSSTPPPSATPSATPAPAPGSTPPTTPRPAPAPGAWRAWPTESGSTVWVSGFTTADTDLRIQALGSLMQTDAVRVIPILRSIALESTNPNEASRAVFVLAQSGRPEAHTTVLEVARRASEPVSVAAVRELGRFGGARVPEALLEIYQTSKPRVKYQVVASLGDRSATTALYRIVQSEADTHLRDAAIVTLGRAGGRVYLQRLYRRAAPDLKRPIIRGLFNARAEDALIEIAAQEKDADLRREVFDGLRLLGTPKAMQYLEKAQTSR